MDLPGKATPLPRHAVIVRDDAFYVRHRNRCFGPFRIQWAMDLSAHELLFDREVVAAISVQPAVYGDMRDLGLPTCVREVAILVFAATCESIRIGLQPNRRSHVIANTLGDHGHDAFEVVAPR